jgi:hypothetical protein
MPVRPSQPELKPGTKAHSAPEPATAGPTALVRGAIMVFVLFHLIAITLWALPVENRLVTGVREVIRPYMLWSGLFQSWDMFAPNPKSVNAYVKAVIITQHRHIQIFTFPRMETLSLRERYSKERYRKFVEVFSDDKEQLLWPDIARHLARTHSNAADPADKIMLIRYVSTITPWAPAPPPAPALFYDEYVDPEGPK